MNTLDTCRKVDSSNNPQNATTTEALEAHFDKSWISTSMENMPKSEIAEITHDEKSAGLVPVIGFSAVLIYDLWGIPGAMSSPYLMPMVVRQLEIAQKELRRMRGTKAKLIILDAFRTQATQTAIFENYSKILSEQYPRAILREKTAQFVSLPDSIYPHGTGGAVDISFSENGKFAAMGTCFDEFTEQSRPDWFQNNPPTSADDYTASKNRSDLHTAMASAGFVGIDSEWWHFECGTIRWGEAKGREAIYKKILAPPTITSFAEKGHVIARQPVLYNGVAQVFLSHSKKAAGLAKEQATYYYQRNTHQTGDHLTEVLKRNMSKACFCHLADSGLAVIVNTLEAIVPRGGTLVYDSLIYYETQDAIHRLAGKAGWNIIELDFMHIEECNLPEHVDVFYCDTPRNWYLDALDIERISLLAHKHNAILIADTTVQPLQPCLEQGVDIVVSSLSKYISMGLTMGGAVFTNDSMLSEIIVDNLHFRGTLMSSETVHLVWCQALSLRDRIEALSRKAELTAEFLENQLGVFGVRTPNRTLAGGLTGGQVSFQLHDPFRGEQIEKLIGHNSHNPRASIHLACTFGSAMTTIEHFGSNKRSRQCNWKGSNECLIPDNMIRLGLGYEPIDDILSELRDALNYSIQYAA